MLKLYRRWMLRHKAKALSAELDYLYGVTRTLPVRIKAVEKELQGIEAELFWRKIPTKWHQGL